MTDDNEKGSKVVKSSIWYTVANVSIRAVAIITTPIYTGMLTTADYGKANTYNSWIDVFNVFACLCVVYSIGRAKLDFRDRFDEYMSSLQSLSSSFGFILLILAFVFRESLSGWIHYEVPLAVGLFAYLCVSPSVEYMMQKCRYEYRYKENILISVITCIGQVALSIILMLLFNDRRYIGKILGVLLPTAIMGIIFYIRFIVKGKVFYNREYWTYALKIGLPMIPHALALILLGQMDRIMIKGICGDGDAGLYIFGYSFATLLMIFTNAIGQAYLPWFNETLFDGKRERIRQIQKKLVLLGCFLSLAFIAVAPEALMILSVSNNSYWIAKYVVPPIVLGTLAQYFYTNYVNVEIFCKKTSIIAVGSCIAALINYLLNYAFIPDFGYIAAAYTTLASYLVLMVMHFVMVRFVLKENVYDDRYMFAAMLIMTVVGIAYLFLYKEGIVAIITRYAVTAAIAAVFAIAKRRDIITLINYVKKRFLGKNQ
ncbi:MAG: oligosaccharide flippase family protein [Lachnospiraceae bacterium]|nr:oligosaccharide flippase family protein [Lachnospiraceae bacterium]